MDLSEISKDTLAQIAKGVTTGLNSTTGLFGVDLTGFVSLVPGIFPFRDMLPRDTAGQGAPTAFWRALLNVNNQQPNPFVGADAAGGVIKTSIQTVSAPYVPLAEGYSVTEDAVAFARGFADAKAVEIFQALLQFKINEDKALIGGQAFALTRPAAPTLAVATTGGSIGAVTATVSVAARSGANYFWGGGNSQSNRASTSALSGATNKVTASIASVPGAFAYDWFYSVDGGTTNFYLTTTTVPTVVISAGIAANQAVPSLPAMSATTPTVNNAADNGSFDANKQFNGLMATLAGDYSTNGPLVSRGSGTNSGAVFVDAAGAALTVSGGGIQQFDTLNKTLYDNVRLSPDAYMISSQEANSISNLLLAQPGAVTYLTQDDAGARGNVVAGGSVGTYVNRAVPGAKIKLEVHPHVPPGTIIARTNSVPFPNSGISQTLSVRCQRDVYDYVYGSDRTSGGPRQDGEARSIETLVNTAPCVFGVVQGILAS